ncbi:MAG: hypothetical protein IJA84_07420 [Clostridia bacterium]|nr:hypothetical protein [Clostridia bacterium]
MRTETAILDAVAARHGISRAEVEREIAAAIHEAIRHPDPQVRRRWKTLWPDGTEPSPAEFISRLAQLTANGKTAFLV